MRSAGQSDALDKKDKQRGMKSKVDDLLEQRGKELVPCFISEIEAGNRSHKVDQLLVSVILDHSSLPGLRVHPLLHLGAHLLNLNPLSTDGQRIASLRCFRCNQFSQQLMVEVVVIEDLRIVAVVLLVTRVQLILVILFTLLWLLLPNH